MTLFSSFVFCETTLKQINDLPEELRLKFYEAVVTYGIYGIEPHFSGLENTVWISMKDIIDTTKAKRKVKQKAGKAGGEAKRDNNQTGDNGGKNGVANPSKTCQPVAKDSNPYQALPNGNGNGNGNVNDNGNGKENEAGSYFSESGFQDDPGLSPGEEPPSGSKPADAPEKNYALIFEQVKSKWKEVTGQETRETLFTVSPPKRERFINALGIYSLEDIFNAIGNYHVARSDPETFDVGGRIYGNLIGFLENGVSQFFKDEAVEFNFRRQKHGG
jgi:hypothetical protein